MKKSIFILLCWIANVSVFAQADFEYKKIKLLYPGETVVYINHTEELDLNLSQGTITTLHKFYEEKMLMSTSAGLYSSGNVTYFDELSKLTKIEASSLIPDGKKYKEIKVKDFKEENSLSRSVFYQGEKNLSYFYPSLTAGAKTVLKYEIDILEPRLISSFFFQRGAPVLESTYKISTPPEIEIDWKLFNIPDSILTFTKTQVKNKTLYSWTVKNLESFSNESDAPDLRYYTPHIAVWIKSINRKEKKEEILGTTDLLYKWYYTISKDCNKDESPELKSIVDSLIQQKTDTLEKVKAIFYWVQDNIKYIAIENGMEGFIPRSGKLVCERRFGDCKDMASITYKMMTYAGIPSYLTWIGSRSIPYKYDELSTPAVDNHMILTVKHQDNYYFLDATGRYIPFGMPSAFIQGKQALIGIDSSHFEIQTVPIIPSFQNTNYDSVSISLVNDKIKGEGYAYLTGYCKINLSYELPSSESDQTKYFRSLLSKGNNKFVIDSFSFQNIYKKDKPSDIHYYFSIDDYAKAFDKEIYVNLLLDKHLEGSEVKENRKLDIENDFTSDHTSIVTFTIPKGYEVKYLPGNSSFREKGYGFDIHYKQEDNVLIAYKKIYIDDLFIKKKDFASWNKMMKELAKCYSEVIILTKN